MKSFKIFFVAQTKHAHRSSSSGPWLKALEPSWIPDGLQNIWCSGVSEASLFLFCEIQWIGERAEERSSSRKDSLVGIHIPGSDWPMQSVQGWLMRISLDASLHFRLYIPRTNVRWVIHVQTITSSPLSLSLSLFFVFLHASVKKITSIGSKRVFILGEHLWYMHVFFLREPLLYACVAARLWLVTTNPTHEHPPEQAQSRILVLWAHQA